MTTGCVVYLCTHPASTSTPVRTTKPSVCGIWTRASRRRSGQRMSTSSPQCCSMESTVYWRVGETIWLLSCGRWSDILPCTSFINPFTVHPLLLSQLLTRPQIAHNECSMSLTVHITTSVDVVLVLVCLFECPCFYVHHPSTLHYYLSLRVLIYTLTVFFTLLHHTWVAITVGVDHHSIALHLIVQKLAFVGLVRFC